MDRPSNWEHKTDEALLEAAAGIDEYTDDGQAAIRAELNRRGLEMPSMRLATFAEAATLARLYRRFVVFIGLQWLPMLLALFDPLRATGVADAILLLSLGASLLALVMAPITGYRLLQHLDVESPGSLAGLMYWPLFSLLALFAIAGYARQWGQRRGVAMGIVGPTGESLARLREGEESS